MNINRKLIALLALLLASPAFSQISRVGVESDYSSSTDDLTVAVPAGTNDDDAMIAFWFSGNNPVNDLTAITASGWTQMYLNVDTANGTDTGVWVGCRIASSEPANYSFNGDSSATAAQAAIVVYAGVNSDICSGFDDGVDYLKDNNTSIINAPDLTTVTDGAMVISMFGGVLSNITACTAPGQLTEFFDGCGNNQAHMALAEATNATAGPFTIGNWTGTNAGVGDDLLAISLSLTPGASTSKLLLFRRHRQ